MWKIFGGKNKEQPPTTQEAIQKLRSTEDMLTKKSEFLEKKIDAETDTARKHGLKNKRGKLCVDMIRFTFDIKEVRNRSGCLPKHQAQCAVMI